MRRTKGSWLIGTIEQWEVIWFDPDHKVEKFLDREKALLFLRTLIGKDVVKILGLYRVRSMREKLYIKDYLPFAEQAPP